LQEVQKEQINMPVNTTLAGLSQTPSSNGPDGAVDPPSTLDDSIRYALSFIALLRDGKASVSEVDVASAATTDIGAANSPYVRVTGTNTITSLGANYTGPRFIRFQGQVALTHNASTLILPGAATIVTNAGDTCIAIPLTAGWYVTHYTRAMAPLTGTVIDRAYAEYTANANLTTAIPFDDTIPQNTEGAQILSVSFTPKSATNRLRLRFQGQVSAASTPINVTAALFSSASANALAADYVTLTTIDYGLPIPLEIEYVPGVTTALTFTVRVGTQSGATARLNGNTSSRLFGGASRATLVIEEIAA
jgi:hypothetical protein